MPSSQTEWDEKYRLAGEDAATEPAGILRELLPLLPGGRVLDLACGTGRNALFLAIGGRHVTAVDWSAAGLGILEAKARSKGISVRRIREFEDRRGPARAGLDFLQADLEKTRLPDSAFAVILCIRYLQRSLFPQMVRALRPGGVLLCETYTQAQLEFAIGPRSPEHLLRPGELRDAFRGLRVLFYRELRAGQGIASLAAQKVQAGNHNQNGN
ncbi:MAG TPA: class I SAM-dependent methyltransferase [Candidatus Angelobacter sp.]|nr:class I SAM-dependent methyltransferase [Candidatus Angelobacter sp.]